MRPIVLLFAGVFLFSLVACSPNELSSSPSFCATPTRACCDCLLPSSSNPTEKAVLDAMWLAAVATAEAQVTRLTRSETPSSALFATPTVTPTVTPRPTSTVWRVEPSVTPVSRLRDSYLIRNQSLPPDFGLGRRYSVMDFSLQRQQMLKETLLSSFQQNQFYVDTDTVFGFWDALEFDWDGDGQTEMALLYSLGQPAFMQFGVALIRADRVIALASHFEEGEYAEYFQVRAIPVSNDKTFLLTQLLTTTSGSGIYPRIYQRMYEFRNGQLKTIWNWQYSGGGRVGWANSWGVFERIRFLHLSGQPERDLLLSRVSSEWADFSGWYDAENIGNYLFYSVSLPGELVFSWNEPAREYQLTHFYDGVHLQRIRPANFFVHAARVNRSLVLDGSLYDWYQVEYIRSLRGYGRGNWGRLPGVYETQAAFDDLFLYLAFRTNPKNRIWLGLDTDLMGDFESDTLNHDDLLFHVELNQENASSCQLTKTALVWPRFASIEVASQPSPEWDTVCIVELRIPLEWLRLKQPLISTTGYALRPRLHPEYDSPYLERNVFTEYYPSAGTLIGFAVIGESAIEPQQNHPQLTFLPFEPGNPTTWGTLLFIADR